MDDDTITVSTTRYEWTWRGTLIVIAVRHPGEDWEVTTYGSGARRVVADHDVTRVGTEFARAEIERRKAILAAEEAFHSRVQSDERAAAGGDT